MNPTTSRQTNDIVDYPITDILDLISLGRAAKSAYQNAMSDGKIDWKDAPYLIPLTTEINAAITGIKNVPKQFADLDETERMILKASIGDVVEDDAFQDIFNGIVLVTRGIIKYRNRSKDEIEIVSELANRITAKSIGIRTTKPSFE